MIDHDSLGPWSMLRFGAAPAAAPEAKTPEFSRIYAFGDSLSDAGNDYTASGGVLPDPLIYYDGRFSNGPVWVQDLAKDLGLPAVRPSLNGGTDFAYGGAEAGQEALHDATPIDLPAQLAEFLVQDPHPSANALYTLSIGANDVLDAIPAYAGNPAEALADIKDAVGNELNFIASLANDGAKNFVILNVPDLGLTPEEHGSATTASQLSATYDQELAASLTTLGARDHLSIHLIDTYQLIDDAVADPAAYGLKNVTTPVWTGDYVNPFSGKLNATGSAQDKYLFFDHLHPTETGHLAIASLALASLK
jgi:phospholipase/lecithinase/hemolysin